MFKILVGAFILLIASVSFAQVFTATLNGVVTDQSGAGIPDATVHIRISGDQRCSNIVGLQISNVTVASGMPAPDWSVTTPFNVAVKTCANDTDAINRINAPTRILNMKSPSA